MASASMELARSIGRPGSRDDFSSVDWADPEIVFVQADLPGSEQHVGSSRTTTASEASPTSGSSPDTDGILRPMSQENVELVLRIYDAVARRDDVTPFEFYAEDIVWDLSHTRRAALYARPVYVGHEGVRENWRESVAAFGNVDLDVEDLTDAGQYVLAVIHERAVGRASGAPVEATHFAVWTLANGKVVRLQVFDQREQAIEAAGLRSGSG